MLFCVAVGGHRNSCWSVWDQGKRSLHILRGENKSIDTSEEHETSLMKVYNDSDAQIYLQNDNKVTIKVAKGAMTALILY